MSEQRTTPGAEVQQEASSTAPDDAPMHVRTEHLPDGRYCLLFTFSESPARE